MQAVNRLAECREKGKSHLEFSAFLEQNSRPRGQSLESYLIMPVQRLLRYKMLLEEILRHTGERSADYDDLNKALELVAARAFQCNEATRGRENMEALRRIQRLFSGVEIVHPKRYREPKNSYVACFHFMSKNFGSPVAVWCSQKTSPVAAM